MRHRIFPSLLSLSLALGLCVLPAAALETDDLKTLLQTYYVDQVPENVLDQDTVQAVLDALNDPYTTYMTAEEYQSFLNQVDGETVVGIGVSIQTTVNDGVQILSVLEGSPAQEAGLSAGDRIAVATSQPAAEPELHEADHERRGSQRGLDGAVGLGMIQNEGRRAADDDRQRHEPQVERNLTVGGYPAADLRY